MSFSVIITTYGDDRWADLAYSRAYPSTFDQIEHQLVICHFPDLTIGPARNAAAREAGRDWLVFLDADDELAPGYLLALHEQLNQGHWGSNVLLQPAVQYVKNGKPGAAHIAATKDLALDNYLVVGTAIRRDTFEAVGGFEDFPHGFEDWSLWAKAWKAGASVIPVPGAVYVAHVNPKSAHKQMWRNRREQVATHLRVQEFLFPGSTSRAQRHARARR